MTSLKWGFFFFVLALLAGLLGFAGLSVATTSVARGIFFGSFFLFLFAVTVELFLVR